MTSTPTARGRRRRIAVAALAVGVVRVEVDGVAGVQHDLAILEHERDGAIYHVVELLAAMAHQLGVVVGRIEHHAQGLHDLAGVAPGQILVLVARGGLQLRLRRRGRVGRGGAGEARASVVQRCRRGARHGLFHLGAHVIVVHRHDGAHVGAVDAVHHVLARELQGRGDDGGAQLAQPTGEAAVTSKDIMLMYFTSGTTGNPKAVEHNFARRRW